MRLCEANAILTEQVMEAEHDCDDAVVDSSTTVVKAGQYRDLHAAFLEECRGVINVLLSARVSVEDHLSNVLRRFREVIHHTVHRAELALAAASIQSNKDLCDMAIRFPLAKRPDDVGALAMEFKGATGAIAKSERVEDVIRSSHHDV